MKFFVTGVNGQLGHDVMNELNKRGHQGVGSDMADTYAGVADGSAVTRMDYVKLDITDKDAVSKVIEAVKPDAVIHCAAWTAGCSRQNAVWITAWTTVWWAISTKSSLP